MVSFDLAALEAQPFDLLLMDLNYTRDTVSEGEGLDLLANTTLSKKLGTILIQAV